MKCVIMSIIVVMSVFVANTNAEDGFTQIFDGKTLKGWDGNPEFWSVQDGAITGQTTKEKPTKGNTFVIWRGGELEDFELRLQFRIVGGNSGIQYRSKEHGKWVIGGYQADFDGDNNWTGTLYEERGRGVLAKRGDKVEIKADGTKQTTDKTTAEADIVKSVKKEGWNDYTIIANGNVLTHIINGNVTIEVTDHQKERAASKGLLALQLHAGPPMTVQFKNIRVKHLGEKAAAAQKKKIVFVAGTASHGYGSHEHFAGCMILANSLRTALPHYDVVVHKNGWPKDAAAFSDADCVVMYADGGGRHPVNPKLTEMQSVVDAGAGVVCIHYGVEVPKGPSGEKFLDWIGGYFETNWSVNPHWVAKYAQFPAHPISNGVKPFEIDDEWYFHMRFRDNMRGVTPILSAHPPESTMKRPDGAHSGNPHVRAAIAKNEIQHMAWASVREDGGRGFGFTGGHNHWNWGDDNFRKVVLNAIVWCAKDDVPENGISDKEVTLEELEKNQDYEQPGNFNRDAIKERFKLTSTKPQKSRPKPLVKTGIITSKTPEHRVKLEANIKGEKNLFLVVRDGGNGYGCDWADWINPRLVGPKGTLQLTELKWRSAHAEFGTVQVNKNCGGAPLRVNGKAIANGIGTHSNSVIHFELPSGYETFLAEGGLDNGGTDQANGNATSVQFAVYVEAPASSGQAGSETGREPEVAVDGLDLNDGLEATLVASEPKLLSLTNLDIDHKGRIWVCEVVNYRRHNGKRSEGDRILILEDTNQDGVADKQKVFYQGRDIDSAMGIAVLGNKVIVSSSPNVLVFTDEDGDDVPDKKEFLFTKTGQPQHDHSAHSFLFGPDGKLYWNFGNTGKGVHDAEGNIVKTIDGLPVVDNGKPFYGGMVFRCNLDGSEFEVLAHNFRNNYEVTVDSFGTLWQSDNDDDGNKGVRINYVMEHGNFGYRDELTGAGWKADRTGAHTEIPLRHWHLRDPGVVPNLLQTGAGSPTGITIYEGDLLPSVYRNQVIHCDAGPNIVRSYPVKESGAGYEASIVDVAKGIDNWFRPADVCVAPDGSLFITDWYDPGVGGHNMQDLERGRLFRVAPPETKYIVPKFDFSTPEGAVEALKNPNNSVRYLAWTAAHNFGEKAEPALLKVFNDNSENPRNRARALWVLGKLEGKGAHYVEKAIDDGDANIRAVGIRLAKQLGMSPVPIVKTLINDKDSKVLRECAIALRHCKSPDAPTLWATLASKHDGKDRWYLEALGIGADKQWDPYFAAWLKAVGDKWNTTAGRDIIWRSRAKAAPALLAKILLDEDTPEETHDRYFRAFDYHNGPEKEAALKAVLGL